MAVLRFATPESTQEELESIMADYHGYLNTFIQRCFPGKEPLLVRWGNHILQRASRDDAITLTMTIPTVDLTAQLS